MKKTGFAPVDPKVVLPKLEHEILDFWEREKIFERSVEARKGGKKFVFFDGPPFANGLPHYGHILANTLKDAVTRYATMRGMYVPRVNGWDCHGLPVEYEIEKELKLAGRKDIVKMGVAKFNAACRKSVFRYTEEWEKLMKRIARWVDFDHSYATLENEYMESIWWVFCEIWNKGLVYQDYKSMHVCPRCETSLSNFEVTLGYKDVADLSVIWKFPLADEPDMHLLAWTTTPWSTPGTTGLSIGPDCAYVKARVGDEYVITAKERLEFVMKGVEHYEVVEEMKGKDLIGRAYAPLLDDFQKLPEVKKNANVYRTFAADYVDTSAGTGIVTINGAYGEIDMEAAKKNGLPIVMDVNPDGRFNDCVPAYQGMWVKEAERKLVEDMKRKGRVWRAEPYLHSYPHCWRCDTPLLNYATKGWFIRVTEAKKKLLANNKKIRWIPSHIQEGRFGKWLEGARDWNISRNRFWGCPIPVWECACGQKQAVGSIKELRKKALGGNTYYLVRHGEAEQNREHLLNSNPAQAYRLTETGKKQAEKAARELAGKKIDLIFASHFPRVLETAEIIAQKTGVSVTADAHLGEHQMGVFDGGSQKEFVRTFRDENDRYTRKIQGGESFEEMEKRVLEFMHYLDRKYSGKRIVLVTHGDVIRAVRRSYEGLTLKAMFDSLSDFAEIREISGGKQPERDGKLDLHKPYIDEITLACEACGKTMRRVPEVLDCWFESGAMPYAQLHYPFENKEDFEKNFPANFIAEGVDQTRGWFYTLHVLATLLFGKSAFENVIVNGILLAADGEKLSKRKKNYPDPTKLFETHGVDSTRLFLLTSTAPLAEDVRFSEKHVEEIVKQFTLPLWNTYSFFVTYANIDGWTRNCGVSEGAGLVGSRAEAYKGKGGESEAKRGELVGETLGFPQNKLDAWILSELNALVADMTDALESYQLTEATRPLLAFIDNLSNWYVRRSRRRFWKSENDSDKNAAYETLFTVLTTLCKLLAPFMPFAADAIFKNLTGKTSVHLEDWPAADKKLIDARLNEEIRAVRNIVSLALMIRAKKNLKVRQPLARVMIALPQRIPQKIVEAYRDVILEELNVKEMAFDAAGEMASPTVTVNARKVGPRFGKETQAIINAAKKGNFTLKKDGTVEFLGGRYVLSKDEIEVGFAGRGGTEVAESDGILVSLDTVITEELRQEGIVREIIRRIQELRKEAGYKISDRIMVSVTGARAIREAVTRFAEFIKKETLALELQEGGDFDWDREEEAEIEGEKVKIGVRK